ncbi:MAG: hypothetical protein BV457_00440 [Thermoplasmata archaeon M9B1D]|nr:MAG: hypothetical protein BV457_00440 [Thermoplasmata archaeon M9B1D]PNX51683.1 MAG: hypothetical protein BV456_02220 [Thermoplasmata archaeon M8B2D]
MSQETIKQIDTILLNEKGNPLITSEIVQKLKNEYGNKKANRETVRRLLNYMEKDLETACSVLHPILKKNAWIHKKYDKKKLKQINIDFEPIIKTLRQDLNRLYKFFDPMVPPEIKIPFISLHFEKKPISPLFKKNIEDLLEKNPTLFKDPFKEIEELKKMELNFYKLRRKITKEIDSIVKATFPKITKEKKEGLIMLLSLRLKTDFIGQKYSLISNNETVKEDLSEENQIIYNEMIQANPEDFERFFNDEGIRFLLKKTRNDNDLEELLRKVKKSPEINKKNVEEMWLKASVAQKRINNLVSFLEIFPQINTSI